MDYLFAAVFCDDGQLYGQAGDQPAETNPVEAV
jgi:hypothetical protein